MSWPTIISAAITLGGKLWNVAGRPISGIRLLVRANVLATLSVSEHLLKLVSEGWARDMSVVKTCVIRKFDAETRKAEQAIAEAADAIARANLHERHARIAEREDELAQARIRQENAKAAVTEAEADRIRLQNREIEVRLAREKQVRVALAEDAVKAAIQSLLREGGAIVVDKVESTQQINQIRGMLNDAGAESQSD